MKLTTEGEAIFEAAQRGENIIIPSFAGVGKSTVSAYICNNDPKPTQYVVYTRNNKKAMAGKVYGSPTNVSTINAFGKSVLDNIIGIPSTPFADAHVKTMRSVGIKKVWVGIQDAWELLRLLYPETEAEGLQDGLLELCELGLVKEHVALQLYDRLPKLYEATLDEVRKGKTDFVDQIWAPLHLAQHRFQTHADRIIVDELQDTSPATLALLKRLPSNVQQIGVGDKFQCIMQFSGAYLENMEHFTSNNNTQTLPLTECFRCPQEVIREANKLVSGIRTTTDRTGEVDKGLLLEMDTLRGLDMVVCGRYAPLTAIYFSCIEHGIPVRFQGRECLEKVCKLLEKQKYDNFELQCASAIEELTEKAEKLPLTKAHENKRAEISDMAACISQAHHFVNSTQELWFAAIRAQSESGVLLSTIHSAKGLEAPNVCFLGSAATDNWYKFPTDYINSDALRLAYVAITRAQNKLYIREIAETHSLGF